MHIGRRQCIALVLCILFFTGPLSLISVSAQDSGPAYGSQYAEDAGQSMQDGEYEPYKPEEFPEWARRLRRYETIFFGTIPFSFLFTSLGFDMYAYAANDFNANYLPLFLGTSPEKEAFNRDTIFPRITVSISLSLVLAYVDYLLDKRTDE